MKTFRTLSLALFLPALIVENYSEELQQKQIHFEEKDKDFYIEYQNNFGDIKKQDHETVDDYWKNILKRRDDLAEKGLINKSYNSYDVLPYIAASIGLVLIITTSYFLI